MIAQYKHTETASKVKYKITNQLTDLLRKDCRLSSGCSFHSARAPLALAV